MSFFTDAGNKFAEDLTVWLQDTRLMSEAVTRLYNDYQREGFIKFAPVSWPKSKAGEPTLTAFTIKPVVLGQRMDVLLKRLWSAQFIFLESLWEEYLQNLLLELRYKDVRIFEPFCDQKFMSGIVRDVLADELQSTEEIKDEAAARFAAGITRQSWREQWAQLSRLAIGLSNAEEHHTWFGDLDTYFELRNCIIHRQGRVSTLLNQKTNYYSDRRLTSVEIWPAHLDYYRWKFIDCITLIESKVEAKYKSTRPARATVKNV